MEKIWHEHLTHLSNSPVRCSYFTLGNPRKLFSTVSFLPTSDYLRYLGRKQTVIHLSTPPENVITLTCEMLNFFIWLKVCCVTSNVGVSEKSRLWVGNGGSEKNRLWCVATGMSGKLGHSKCSKWPPSAWIRASSVFCRSVASYTRSVSLAVLLSLQKLSRGIMESPAYVCLSVCLLPR